MLSDKIFKDCQRFTVDAVGTIIEFKDLIIYIVRPELRIYKKTVYTIPVPDADIVRR